MSAKAVTTREVRRVPAPRELPEMNEKEVWELQGIGSRRYTWLLTRFLVSKGADEQRCPTDHDLAALVFGGAVIAALTDEYVVLEKVKQQESASGDVCYVPKKYILDLSIVVFNEICRASARSPDRLDPRVVAEILGLFYPELHHSPPDDPYRESAFEYVWARLPYLVGESFSTIHIEKSREDLEFERFVAGTPIEESLRRITDRVPRMLNLTVGRHR